MNNKPKNIYGFWHISVMGNKWQEIVQDQYQTLCDSGLLTASKKVYVCVVGGNGTEDFSHLKNVTILSRNPNLKVSELFTLRFLKKFCKHANLRTIMGASSLFFHPELLSFADSDDDSYVWYIHTKGASHAGSSKYPNVWDWRKYMEYFIVERWKDCVKALDEGFDVCGVEWSWHDLEGNVVNENPSPHRMGTVPNAHFCGNFWWSTSHHINRLDDDLVAHGNRYNAETFIGGGSIRHGPYGHLHIGHYQPPVQNKLPESGIRVKNFHYFFNETPYQLYTKPHPRSYYTSDPPLK